MEHRIRNLQHRIGRVVVAAAMTTSLAITLPGVVSPPAYAAPDNPIPQSDLGYPSFKGDEHPVPDTGVSYSPENSYLRAVFDKDLAEGAGTDSDHDFWIDRMLVRTGPGYSGPDQGGNENEVAFTRGRAAFMKTHQPGGLGWRGDVAYWESLGRNAIELKLLVDGEEVSVQEDSAARKQTPSYFRSVHNGAGLQVVQEKFITNNNVMVVNLSVSGLEGAKDVKVVATSPLTANATSESNELTGEVTALNDITTLYPRLSGDGFAVQDGALVTDLAVPSGESVTTKVQLGLITEEISESSQEYEAYKALSPSEAFTKQVTDYNMWWVENLVYLDTPEDNIDKTLFYRWWLMRYNYLDANVPGNDYQFPTSMEGVLGYNNAIVLTVGMFIDDLKYFRDPVYSFGPALSAGETSKSYKFVDNPGDPANWNNSYTQYITEAAWRAYETHGGPGVMGEPLGRHSEYDVTGLLDAYDNNGNGLIEYNWGAMTGNDADAVSLHWKEGTYLDRTENAYLYSNAKGAAEFYRIAGDEAGAARMEELAQQTRTAILENLWEDATDTPDEMGHNGNLLKHRVATGDRELVPWKEINNYYPFNVGLMPKEGDSDYDPKYVEALRLFQDAEEYPVFPFFTANQRDKKASQHSNENNFSIINSTVLFNTYSSVLRDYPSEYVTPEMYKQLLYWNAWAHYQGGDNRMPNQNEFWNTASAENGGSIGYRSWILHTILGTTNFTVIEDVAGLQARADNKLELSPIDIGWDYFTANNIRYHGQDLTIVWDKDGSHYGGPAGYSAYLDGQKVFTVDQLVPVIYDPDTGQVSAEGGGTVVDSQQVGLSSATAVSYGKDSRVYDIFSKAGTDLNLGRTNVAEGAQVTASFEADGRPATAAVNGTTINEPFWGTAGTRHASDTLEVDFGAEQTIDDVRVFFYRTSTTATVRGYSPPQQYIVEYWDGSDWVPVQNQARIPVYATGNYNRVQFSPVNTQKIKLTVTHAAGAATGVKEIQAYNSGEELPASTNAAPRVTAKIDSTHKVPNQARLLGVVSDDGLPSGMLSSQWSVESAPEGAEAIFASPQSPSTTVQFTEVGEYQLKLSVSDGELTADAIVTVNNTGSDGARINVALSAKASASVVTNWNDVNAINDGKAPQPTNSEADAWGTWGTQGPYIATLTWDNPVRIDGSGILFHDDNGGVRVPETYTMEYLDTDGNWQEVPNHSGYTTTKGAFSQLSFDSVTTTAVRVDLPRRGNAYPGIVEWEVYSENPVSLAPVVVRTSVGNEPVLPENVEVVYRNGDRVLMPVNWQSIEPEKYAVEGSFEVYGEVAGIALLPKATVYVRSAPAAQVNVIHEQSVTTTVGVAPQLPSFAIVLYNDGSEEMLPVTWQDVDPQAYAEPGEFVVQGAVPGTDKLASVTVTVNDSGTQRPTITLVTEETPHESGWFGTDVTVVAHAEDAIETDPVIEIKSGEEWVPYASPITITEEGQHTVTARAIAGDRISNEVTLAVNIDKSGPMVESQFDQRSRVLSFEAVDSASGVASIEYQIGDGEWIPYVGAVELATASVVNYRATDNVGNQSEVGNLSIEAPAEDWLPNIAPLAEVEVSGSADWNKASGVNDRVVSKDKQDNIWGTYGVEGDSHWATLTWPETQRIDKTRLFFFDDGGGMRLPASWSLEYLGEDGRWYEVPNVTPGFILPASADDPVEVSHDPVETTALRVNLNKSEEGFVGLLEWEVYAAKEVKPSPGPGPGPEPGPGTKPNPNPGPGTNPGSGQSSDGDSTPSKSETGSENLSTTGAAVGGIAVVALLLAGVGLYLFRRSKKA